MYLEEQARPPLTIPNGGLQSKWCCFISSGIERTQI